ncbi:hypothetical protein LCGC14_2642640, partial [marine sediment metagenome]
ILYFYNFLKIYATTYKQEMLGLILFIFIAPTLILGFVPLTDSAGMFFIVLALYQYSIKSNIFIRIVTISIGILARETVFFIVPLIIIWSFMDIPNIFKKHGFKKFKNWDVSWKRLFKELTLLPVIPFTVLIILKMWAPEDFLTIPTITNINININNLMTERTLTTIGQLLIIGIIGIYGNFKWILYRDKQVWKLLFGIIIFSIPLFYTFLYENISFRFFWIFFVFAIPLMINSIDKLGEMYL